VLAPVLAPVLALLIALGGCASGGRGTRGPAGGVDAPGAGPRTASALTRAGRARLRDTVRAVLRQAIADSAFPGAVVVIGSAREVLLREGFGVLDPADRRRPDDRTVWDLASLTKVVGTTTAVLALVAEGRVALDSPAVRYLPQWAGGSPAVTVRHLLTHSAGLPAGRPYYRTAATREEALAQLFETRPDTAPGGRYLYSDIGFLLLGQLVETVRGAPLDEVVAATLSRPLGLRDTRFRPPASWVRRTAPTEMDPWRGRQVRGEVHDENAVRFGGVAGHAGLFSSGRDLARVAQLLLRRGEWNGRPVLPSATLGEFLRLQQPLLSHRALGWETPSGTNSAGARLSPRAAGHTGFTGTSLWVDPDRDLFVILLTNRVNPSRQNTRIGAVRVALANAVLAVVDPPAPVVGLPAP
jgi:CubicO group peptidase (beta-lactamase class C family)